MDKTTNEEIRHSASHVLAQAVLEKFPNAQLGIGPTIDDGFYYDFDLPEKLTVDDLEDLENRMHRIIKEKQLFIQTKQTRQEAVTFFEKKNQPYKLEIIKDLDLDQYSFYQNGSFTDLCSGPHVANTHQIKAIKLLRISGAYWRGSEKNPMLQRIYGTAFPSRKELAVYLHQLEEAKKRDHRVIGKALNLFSIQESLGGGLILWHPNGTKIREIIETYWKQQHDEHHYQLVRTPHIGPSSLWKTSGHLDFYKENMFGEMSNEHSQYILKPMNCPFHILIYNHKQHSYRELPVRLAELGSVYRYERSGVLHGLMRVRGFTQDDAHIICTADQVNTEIKAALDFSLALLSRFGFDSFKLFLSTQPSDKYIGENDQWQLAETALRHAIESTGISYDVDHGGGAFYGPKIDIKITDSIGRLWQCSTIQFDFNLPEKFNMIYIGKEGKKQRPIMIHRALLGSIERFFGILIEHYNGIFPLWLAPVQVKLLTVTQSVVPYAQRVAAELKTHGIRATCDANNEKIGYKIRQAMTEKIPYTIIIGEKEVKQTTIALRSLSKGDLGTMTVSDLVTKLEAEQAYPVN